MGWAMRALVVAGMGAMPALAQVDEVDLVGTWTCTIAQYGSGGQASDTSDSVFNMALYRTGDWASSGRYANGSPYSGQGTWRFGRNLKGGMQVSVEGLITSGIAIPQDFGFEADLESNDAFSRTSKRYGTTTAVECSRMEGS
ncbi:MAG: hypothetical protein AAGC57_08785 [Pseudomonadota bacterium]